jgi:D-serine deaminase-like pyridoxal phosphate-dependent protein
LKIETTPAFLVDRSIVQRNCDRMREKAARSGVHFRPHVKTHKVTEIGRMQHGGGPGPITVSTLAEAEFFAEDGFRDITYAVPIAPEKLSRAAAIAARIDRLNVLIDDERALRAIEEFHRAESRVFDVFLKIDCGYHRAGVDPDAPESVRLAQALAKSPAVRFRGLLTHAGHSYHARTVEEIRGVAREETSAVTRFRDRAGPRDLVRSIGSTPTASVVERFDDCEEVRPGNYVFYDAFQAVIGSCTFADCAVSVLATVIGAYQERRALVLDAGALALSKDAGPDHIDAAFGYGIVCDENLRPLKMKLVALSQEHGKVEADAAAIREHPIGSRVRIVPNHSCLTAAMYDVYHVLENGTIVDEWKPVRGW